MTIAHYRVFLSLLFVFLAVYRGPVLVTHPVANMSQTFSEESSPLHQTVKVSFNTNHIAANVDLQGEYALALVGLKIAGL